MSGLANILLVDDNSKYLKDALPLYGYDVKVVHGGVQALEVLTNSDKVFDMVIVDILLPDISGFDFIKKIRNINCVKYIPIVVLSSEADEKKIISALKIGADDYITKPFLLPNLLARVEAILRRANWSVSQHNQKVVSSSKKELSVALTSRELEVLQMAAKGVSNKHIAEKLFVKEVNVKTHLNSIFKKLKVDNRTQATLKALQMNLIED